ncbi:C-terminal processing peptidase [Handroanthus impetiginosus]|uniref:C-terminal processing peptidase n=1 Tax=Handroanthus impetiginosus TaxID=429701 RepID=A0A2G9G2H1_9LAMI|nr:C-terminal processing peptidase [Handroanthus impetiginosus]
MILSQFHKDTLRHAANVSTTKPKIHVACHPQEIESTKLTLLASSKKQKLLLPLMKMEALSSNLDCTLSSLSRVPKLSSKPTSKPLFSCRFPRLNGRRNKNLRVKTVRCLDPKQGSSCKNGWFLTINEDLVNMVGRGVFAFAAAAFLCCDSPSFAESLTVAFPVSHTREVNTVQRTLVEAWGLIRETFIDPTFNHQDWDSKLQQTMVEMFPLRSEDAAYNKIKGMLSTLGDPFTRIISPKEYQSFRIGSDGNLQGVGLFVNIEPRTGHLVVLACIENSPAARAGIHEGDELMEINGERLDGVPSEAAAQKLRGRVGTTVTIKVQSVDNTGSSCVREVKIPREVIRLSPISSAIIFHRAPNGHLLKTGYVKLSTFSQTAAMEMENTVHEMENQGVQSYILDLRNNPGGLVKAGLDVAQMWLDGTETLVNTIDRDGNMLPINMIDGHAITHDPLVVLVNEGSASANEILAGALHDNGRAILVGHRTFGKGKIQSVTELHDGSALFVTVAKYLSPALHDIDQVGITPDVQCTTDFLNSPKDSLKNGNLDSSLESDSCILVAEHQLDIQG